MNGPRERLALWGATVLSDVELLAVLLGTGHAGKPATTLAAGLLEQSGGLLALSRLTAAELGRAVGVGPTKAARLAAAFEVGSRALSEAEPPSSPLSNSEAVFARYGRSLMRSRIERFLVIAVDAKNRPRAVREIARGGRTTCQVDPAEVFRMLVSESASGAVFVHNHPSGDPEPSSQDLELTERLVEGGVLLSIRVLDHLVVGHGRYTSLRDAGLWPRNAVISSP